MKRGPSRLAAQAPQDEAGGRRGARNGDDRSMADKAAAAYGGAAPDWVMELARLADREGLRGAEKRIGYSASALSTVINGRYAGDLGRVEEKVRGALMGSVVACPVLGEIGRDRCLDWQKKPFAATSSIRVAVYHGCRSGCPHSALRQAQDTALREAGDTGETP